MPYVKMPSKTQNLWVDPKAILSLEFFDVIAKPVAKKGKKTAEQPLIVIAESYRAKPRCQLHMHNMQVVEFELPPDATEESVIELLSGE